MSRSNRFISILTGTAIGAALGILFAPDKGSVTRQKISQKTNETGNKIANSTQQLKTSVTEGAKAKKETLDARMESIVSDASYKAEDVITTLEEKLQYLKEKNRQLQHDTVLKSMNEEKNLVKKKTARTTKKSPII